MKCNNKICGKCGNMYCYVTDVTEICRDEPIREICFCCLNNKIGLMFPIYYEVIETWKLDKEGVWKSEDKVSVMNNEKLNNIFKKTEKDNFYVSGYECKYEFEHLIMEANNEYQNM